jgi:hypothetical protein
MVVNEVMTMSKVRVVFKLTESELDVVKKGADRTVRSVAGMLQAIVREWIDALEAKAKAAADAQAELDRKLGKTIRISDDY